jgi:hypothetical protein
MPEVVHAGGTGARILFVAAGLFIAPGGFSSTGSTTQTLTAAISPIAKLSVPGTLTITSGSTYFLPFQGSVSIAYRVRSTLDGRRKYHRASDIGLFAFRRAFRRCRSADLHVLRSHAWNGVQWHTDHFHDIPDPRTDPACFGMHGRGRAL